MRTTITTLACIFIGLLATAHVQAEVDQEYIPAHGVASSVPTRDWQAGMLSGNGRMGAIAYGPADGETLIFNHALLYLPIPRKPVIDVAQYWPEMLRLMREKGHKAAMAFTQEKAKQQGYKCYPMPESDMGDSFHLAFTLKIETEISQIGSARIRSERQHSPHVNKAAGDFPPARRLAVQNRMSREIAIPNSPSAEAAWARFVVRSPYLPRRSCQNRLVLLANRAS